MLILTKPIYDFALFFNNAIVAEDYIASLCNDLAFGMYYAMIAKNNAALVIRLASYKAC